MTETASVLVVDDNEDLLNTFSLILKRRGFDVATAEDGACAVDKFSRGHFDVILMDIVMPRMNGVEAFRRIREINPDARVILMTAYSEDNLMQLALDEGARCIVHKPLNIDHMIELLRETAMSHLILLVDDDDDIRQTMARTLEMKGYEVLTAASGEEAVVIARERPCQIAFVDVKLPLMNGLETCLRLKAINPSIVPIMMTGYRDEVKELVAKALSSAAATCLYKPFDPLKALGLVKTLRNKNCLAGNRDERERQYISSR
ncbi:MAG: response regulator [Chloroflexota bacterium]